LHGVLRDGIATLPWMSAPQTPEFKTGARYRVIGTLSNMPEFRAAFQCAAGDKMVRADSCQIW
jgi:hypothetical protein